MAAEEAGLETEAARRLVTPKPEWKPRPPGLVARPRPEWRPKPPRSGPKAEWSQRHRGRTPPTTDGRPKPPRSDPKPEWEAEAPGRVGPKPNGGRSRPALAARNPVAAVRDVHPDSVRADPVGAGPEAEDLVGRPRKPLGRGGRGGGSR